MTEESTPRTGRLTAFVGRVFGSGPETGASRRSRRAVRIFVAVGLLAVALFVFSGPATLAAPRSCNSCHATSDAYSQWRSSPHSSVRCEQCHTDRASALGVGNSFALASDAWRGVLGTHEPTVPLRDEACIACHPTATLNKPTVIGTLRISHAGLSEGGYRCTDCHAGVAHNVPTSRVSTPTMSLCARCHNNVTVPGKCTLCHTTTQSPEAARRNDPEWSKTHGPKWRQLHGMGELSTCTICHSTQDCQKCHGVPLPHDTNFIAEHGALATQSKPKCLNCHIQSFCDSCHGLPIPHPSNFLSLHPKVAKNSEDPRCLKCHVSDDCATCHKQHIHPHGPGI